MSWASYQVDIVADQTRLGLVKTVNIQAAKTHLSRLVEEAVEGEEIILAKAGKPLVRLVPYERPQAPRGGGYLKGLWISPDFDKEDPEINELFYGRVE